MSEFFSKDESILNNNFINNGYVICKVDNKESLNWIKNFYLKKIEFILERGML